MCFTLIPPCFSLYLLSPLCPESLLPWNTPVLLPAVEVLALCSFQVLQPPWLLQGPAGELSIPEPSPGGSSSSTGMHTHHYPEHSWDRRSLVYQVLYLKDVALPGSWAGTLHSWKREQLGNHLLSHRSVQVHWVCQYRNTGQFSTLMWTLLVRCVQPWEKLE